MPRLPDAPVTVVLDAGALIAVERGVRWVALALQYADEVHVPAGALAQAWRDPSRQVRLVRLLATKDVRIHPLDADAARAAGRLCASAGSSDVIDASVVTVARQVDGVIFSSDPVDLRRLDPGVPITTV